MSSIAISIVFYRILTFLGYSNTMEQKNFYKSHSFVFYSINSLPSTICKTKNSLRSSVLSSFCLWFNVVKFIFHSSKLLALQPYIYTTCILDVGLVFVIIYYFPIKMMTCKLLEIVCWISGIFVQVLWKYRAIQFPVAERYSTIQ